MQNWQYLVLINLAPNLTTQIKLLHSFDAEGLVFKTAWGFPIFSMVRLQFFYQVAYQNFTNTHWVKGHCNWYLGSLPTKFQASSLNFQTPLIFSKKTYLCQSRFFLLSMFCQHFTSVGDHTSNYVNTLKMEMPGVLQSLSCDRP